MVWAEWAEWAEECTKPIRTHQKKLCKITKRELGQFRVLFFLGFRQKIAHHFNSVLIVPGIKVNDQQVIPLPDHI